VIDRLIAVEVERPVRVVARVTVVTQPKGRGWVKQLEALVTQIEAGRVYDRDLSELAKALDAVSQAIEGRPGWGQFLRRGAQAQRRFSSYDRG
jgi:hypothetical protein